MTKRNYLKGMPGVSQTQFPAPDSGTLNSVILHGSINKAGITDEVYRREFNRKNFTAVLGRG